MDIKELKHKIALDSARIYTENQCKNLATSEKFIHDPQYIKLYDVYILDTYLKAYKSNLELLEKEDPTKPRSAEVLKTFEEIKKIYQEDK